MSKHATSSPANDPATASTDMVRKHHGRVPLLVAAVMILLALGGVAITMANLSMVRMYWVALMPIYGVLSMLSAYRDKRFSGMMIVRQALHWAGVGVAIYLDLTFLQGAGEQTSMATGLSSLLLLALGCYLAGINMEWPFVVVGLFLTLTFVFLVAAQQYTLLLLVIGGVLFAALVTIQKLIKNQR